MAFAEDGFGRQSGRLGERIKYVRFEENGKLNAVRLDSFAFPDQLLMVLNLADDEMRMLDSGRNQALESGLQTGVGRLHDLLWDSKVSTHQHIDVRSLVSCFVGAST